MSSPEELELEQALAPFLTVGAVLVLPISTLSAMFLTYGIYILIFGVSIRVLLRPGRPTTISNLYLPCTIFSFIMATIYVGTVTAKYVHQAVLCFTTVKTKEYLQLAEFLTYDVESAVEFALMVLTGALMNIVADCMLIHRCYACWGFRRAILIPLVVMAVALDGLDFITSIGGIANFNTSIPGHSELYDKFGIISNGDGIAIAAFNMLLTVLTAGRIWWTSRKDLKGAQNQEMFSFFTAAIIESGAMFSITKLVAMIVPLVVDPNLHGLVPIDLATLAVLLSGLAPTLIIVRVAYRSKSNPQAEQNENFISRSMAFADRPVGQSACQSPSVDLRSQIGGHKGGNSSGEEGLASGSSEKMV
ncbi:hypothetical protein E1B28_005284 [Marasmius oreades]|uniref:Uncharacterized protein n=1 Tax=Marasmius oreades TaxID=181124 RepID=A0A9P7V0A9_9AGAR|nr:uncharacterized protein E1B28_005284 [Marasmius oreades]KAG7097974.1 hypothetical protein E1B28_005284 [Marasmius oreades]